MTPYLWECPDCDVRVRTNSQDLADRMPTIHRQVGCKGRPAKVTVLPDGESGEDVA